MRLVTMFLNYSALESGKLVLQLRRQQLDRLRARPDVPLAGRFSKGEGPAGKYKDRSRLAICSEFDYQKVQQCMANLLDNALKHTPTGGCVALAAKTSLLGAAYLGAVTLAGIVRAPRRDAALQANSVRP